MTPAQHKAQFILEHETLCDWIVGTIERGGVNILNPDYVTAREIVTGEAAAWRCEATLSLCHPRFATRIIQNAGRHRSCA